MSAEWREDIEFYCPKCGSNEWGSHENRIHCGDCGFGFQREDMWKYSMLIRARNFTGREDYERHE